jgi:dinuclear metal center YbgI/SA1388 family protein
VRLSEVVSELDAWFPADLAEPWDAVGLVFGRPEAEVASALIAVDPTPDVAADAVAGGFDLLITHHPLWLGGVTHLKGYKGRLAQDLITAGVALYNAHTNADRAADGVNDALAAALGLHGVRPLERLSHDLLRLTVYVPNGDVDRLIDALSVAGAGAIGDYDRCAYTTSGEGTFRPLSGADPHIGAIGCVERVAEQRLEMVLPQARMQAVAEAVRAVHPYEEPAYDFTTIRQSRPDVGLGRVGGIGAMSLADFADHVSRSLPQTPTGVRFAGDPERRIETVAVVGGSGGSELAAASAVADVLVTSDLKHHVVDEHITGQGCAVIDVAHFASEWPWCPRTAQRLTELGVAAQASTRVTDPWVGRR